jgi:hypothetical protein
MIWGWQKTDDALAGPSVSPEQKERIRKAGYAEAAQCVPVGATIGVLPLVMAAIAIAVSVVRMKGEKKD